MKGSYLARQIDEDYRREQYMKRKAKRQICKDKDCTKCGWNPICEDKEIKEESEVQ